VEPRGRDKDVVVTVQPSLIEILLMDHPLARLSLEGLFVLFCASVGASIAWLIEQIRLLPEWLISPFTILFTIACAIGGLWTCFDSRRKLNRYFSLRDELEQLYSNGHDQEFVTDSRELEQLNNIES